MEENQLLPASEVARRLNLSIRTVQDMMRTNKIPSCKVSNRRRMVPAGALDTWIKQNTDWPDPSSTESHQQSGMSSGGREAANVAALRERQTVTPLKDG